MSPETAKLGFIGRCLLVTACAAALILLWRVLQPMAPADPASRLVTARGDLAGDEKATIALFEKARGSVVYISTSQLVEDAWTRNVFSVPRGTGSGLIWDGAGHVVTNFHVIQGASEATVQLADGRKFRASLVGASPSHDLALLKIGVALRRPAPVRTLQIAIGNGRYYGGGNAVHHDARIDDAALDLYSLELQRLWQLLVMYPAFKAGRHSLWREVRSARCDHFDVWTRRPRPVNLDGELKTFTPVSFKVLPAAISVFTP
nr:trypsin-like peptidase domain-containing protein [Sphingobium sp. IP1]